MLELVFEHGFHYFSDTYDLSLPYSINKVQQPTPQARKYYDQFIWNRNLLKMDESPPPP